MRRLEEIKNTEITPEMVQEAISIARRTGMYLTEGSTQNGVRDREVQIRHDTLEEAYKAYIEYADNPTTLARIERRILGAMADIEYLENI